MPKSTSKATKTQTSTLNPNLALMAFLRAFMDRFEERDEARLKLENDAAHSKLRLNALAGALLPQVLHAMGPRPAPLLDTMVHESFEKSMRGLPQTPRVKLPDTFTDDRGKIINIANAPVGSAVLITSKKGTTRAKHWHREDAHLCFVIRGEIEYYERPHVSPEYGNSPELMRNIMHAGESFFTGPNVEHEMYFTMDTEFLTLGRLSRTPEEYEKDLVRLDYSLRDMYLKKDSDK